MRLLAPALCLGGALGLTAQTAPAPGRIQLLIITGQDKHPWRETTPYLREILNRTGRFEVRVTEEFHGATAETLAPYDVAILNYSDEKLDAPAWSPTTRGAFLSFVRSGKGLVVYHHSAASFQNWCNHCPAARSITITPNESGSTAGLPFPAGGGPNFAKATNKR